MKYQALKRFPKHFRFKKKKLNIKIIILKIGWL